MLFRNSFKGTYQSPYQLKILTGWRWLLYHHFLNYCNDALLLAWCNIRDNILTFPPTTPSNWWPQKRVPYLSFKPCQRAISQLRLVGRWNFAPSVARLSSTLSTIISPSSNEKEIARSQSFGKSAGPPVNWGKTSTLIINSEIVLWIIACL